MADWCGDVVRNIPVVFRALEAGNVPTEVLIMEENLDTMDQFLTMGGRSVPVVIVADAEGNVHGTWGQDLHTSKSRWLSSSRKILIVKRRIIRKNLTAARQEIMRRYGDGTGYQALVVQELRALIESV